MRERGTSLVEVVIAAAILAALASILWSVVQGARPFGMRSAADQFDASLAYAQALAANSGNGATMVFDRRASADGSGGTGFVLTIYAGRPTSTGVLSLAPLAPVIAIGEVREGKLGGVPFTIFLNGAGHASAMSGAVTTATVLASDPGCPTGENRIALTFWDARASQTRSIPCNAPLAGPPADIGAANP